MVELSLGLGNPVVGVRLLFRKFYFLVWIIFHMIFLEPTIVEVKTISKSQLLLRLKRFGEGSDSLRCFVRVGN